MSTLDKKFKIALVVFSAPYNTSVLSDLVLDGERGSTLMVFGLFEDKIGKQVVVQPVEWSDSRIHIKVPTEGLASDNTYYIRVANRGMISYKTGGQDDESKFELSMENRGGGFREVQL